MTITIHKGSILDCDVDVIVNPANSFLMNGAGLAKVIEDAAQGTTKNAHVRESYPQVYQHDEYRVWGAAIREYNRWRAHKKLIPYGSAVLSPPGALCPRFKGIIHAVGPIWGGGEFYENKLLFSAYHRSIALARNAGFGSIAFPAISAGIFGAPIGCVANQAVLAARETALDVTFALMDDDHIEAFRKRLTA